MKKINDLVYRIHKPPRGNPRVVHFNRLAPYAGNHDQVRVLRPPEDEMTFQQFMSLYSNGQKVVHGVTREEPRDLFKVPVDYALAHCVAKDLQMSKGIAVIFNKKFGQLQTLRGQNPEVGGVLQLKKGQSNIFYLVTKKHSRDKPSYEDVWRSLTRLRDTMLDQNLVDLAIPKLASGLDRLDFGVW
ncbi:ADP-ribose glycohydrolase OARD1-like isoform X2 [Leptinotarsa decemlineata]|uniref:ADP-ribose glycohydrolase OARD1-like isoform X2 n=1 Tax=Leptinotarsa decemlineata TaxID=7539 RepID=UPI003D30B48E